MSHLHHPDQVKAGLKMNELGKGITQCHMSHMRLC